MNHKTYFTPGPSELYPTVRQHMIAAMDEKIGAISHRSKQFKEIYKVAVDNLRTLLGLPAEYDIVFTASATEIWERLIQNSVESISYHCVNGSFSKRFSEITTELGKKSEILKVDFGKSFNSTDIKPSGEAETICLIHNETSSGAMMPAEEINKVKALYPDKLVYVDVVSALPHPQLNYSQLDSVYFSVQKCFGLPAGLGVWLVHNNLLAKAEAMQKKGLSIGSYHTLPALVSKSREYQTPETPNVLAIYLLGKVLSDMLNKGVDTIRKETELKANMIYDYLEASNTFNVFVKEKSHRSRTTIIADTQVNSAEVNKALEPSDMAVGSGYGSYKDTQIRIANFPTHSVEQMERLVKRLKEIYG